MTITTIGIAGAGQMGSGIAQVAAQAGLSVLLYDAIEGVAPKAKARIDANLGKLVAKGKLTDESRAATLARITPVASLAELGKSQIVCEAIVENPDIKVAFWQALDAVANPDTIFATNTSSISVTMLAAKTRRPDRFVGIHFFNPVPVMKLVEIIPSLTTSDATLDAATAFALALDKSVVRAADRSGFIVNRVLVPMINEAARALMEGVGSARDIDTAMKLGCNHPMGPLELADFIGLDTCVAILEVLERGLGDPRYAPCPLMRQYVDAGYHGRKTGRGFYDYTATT